MFKGFDKSKTGLKGRESCILSLISDKLGYNDMEVFDSEDTPYDEAWSESLDDAYEKTGKLWVEFKDHEDNSEYRLFLFEFEGSLTIAWVATESFQTGPLYFRAA